MAQTKAPRIVAELGRPETAAETAARKAESSKNYRERKTINNLWFSIIVCVGFVALMIFIVPRDDSSRLEPVDYGQVAVQAQESMPTTIANPELPKGWSANVAEVRTAASDNITSWYVGFITPKNQFIGLTQAVDANPSWLANELYNSTASGTVTIAGVTWTIYDNRGSDREVGNAEYALVTESGTDTFVLAGTATDDEFETLATAVAPTVASVASSSSTTSAE